MGYLLQQEAIRSISRRLNLITTDREQDWDIELADASRLNEFFTVYQQDSDLNESEKYALMALILASCDDLIQQENGLDLVWWEELKNSLLDNPHYRDLVEYWALPGETDVANQFMLTPYIRLVWDRISEQKATNGQV